QVLHASLEVGFDLVFVSGVGVDDVPVAWFGAQVSFQRGSRVDLFGLSGLRRLLGCSGFLGRNVIHGHSSVVGRNVIHRHSSVVDSSVIHGHSSVVDSNVGHSSVVDNNVGSS